MKRLIPLLFVLLTSVAVAGNWYNTGKNVGAAELWQSDDGPSSWYGIQNNEGSAICAYWSAKGTNIWNGLGQNTAQHPMYIKPGGWVEIGSVSQANQELAASWVVKWGWHRECY